MSDIADSYSIVKPLSLDYPWLVAFTTLAEHNGRRVDFTADTCEAKRRELESALAPLAVTWLSLEHGARIVELEQSIAALSHPSADGAILTEPGFAVAFTTADCLPIVIVSEHHKTAAAIHAGWRSIAAGIIEATIDRLEQHEIKPASLQVWIGPSIAGEDYEVSDEVRDKLLIRPDIAECHFALTRPGHWLADLPRAAEAILISLGIPAASIERCPISTAKSPLFHSARRDGSMAGRMATVTGIKKVNQP